MNEVKGAEFVLGSLGDERFEGVRSRFQRGAQRVLIGGLAELIRDGSEVEFAEGFGQFRNLRERFVCLVLGEGVADREVGGEGVLEAGDTLGRRALQLGEVAKVAPLDKLSVVFVILQPAIVERHWRDLTPIDAQALPDDLPDRASNIAGTRYSKGAYHRHGRHYLLLKAGPGEVTWHNDAGHRLDLRHATDQQGAGVLTIETGNTWRAPGPLWLVENQALFDRLDWLPQEHEASVIGSSIAYYSGQLPTGLIDWLAERPRT
jgi:hypothetical protein